MILAGPIVRRVTPRSVTVWVASSVPASLRLSIFDGIIPVGPGSGLVTGQSPRNTSTDQPAVKVGASLHVGVVTLALPASQQLDFGQLYSYNLTLVGAATEDLKSLGLLAEGPMLGKPHLPLGYDPNTLPAFVVPPPTLDDVRIYHASCRKPQGQNPDALAFLDDQIAAERANPLLRPHQLFLTGDQIYADDVPISLLPHITALGQRLIGADEILPLAGGEVAVNQETLPAGFRQLFLNNAVGFSSQEADSHLISLGEFCAAYLIAWSNLDWPDMEARTDGVPDALVPFDHQIDVIGLDAAHREALFTFPDSGGPPSQRTVEFFYRLSDENRTALFEKFDDDFLAFKYVRDTAQAEEGLEFLLSEARTVISGETESEGRRKLEAFRKYTEGFIGLYKTATARSKSHARRTAVYFDTLPKVRRALANVATYMIFDDHEISDDWYLNREWRARALAAPAGRTVLRNGLLAYGLFQGWGNDPARFLEGFTGSSSEAGTDILLHDATAAFATNPTVGLGKEVRNVTDGSKATIRAIAEDTLTTTSLTGGTANVWGDGDSYEVVDGTNLPMLEHVSALYASGGTPDPAAAAALDALFGLNDTTPAARWDYEVPGPLYHVRVLDTRTRREFLGPRDPPNLLGGSALDEQLPPGPLPAGLRILVVVSPVPVLGPPVIEELLQPAAIRAFDLKQSFVGAPLTGAFKLDLESWSANPPAFERLLARLTTYGQVLVLSGDVHYATGFDLLYWKGNASVPARVVQFTSSAAKNEFQGDLIFLFKSTFGQRAQRLDIPLERLAWADSDTDPVQLSATAPTPPSLRARLNKSPVLIPTHGWPAGTTRSPDPEWRWRMKLLSDVRPDPERPEPLQPDALDGPVTASDPFESYRRVARRHVAQLEKDIFGRQIVFGTNIGRVTFLTLASGAVMLRHDLLAVHPNDPLARPLAYTRHDVSLEPAGENPPDLPSS
jgi:hypothetical protein